MDNRILKEVGDRIVNAVSLGLAEINRTLQILTLAQRAVAAGDTKPDATPPYPHYYLGGDKAGDTGNYMVGPATDPATLLMVNPNVFEVKGSRELVVWRVTEAQAVEVYKWDQGNNEWVRV